jgi:thiol-disulfide isomerase/thioredoxin
LRRLAALVAVLLLMTACGAPHITPPPPSKVDVATPAMVALKAKSHIQDCPKPETTGGVLPKVTVKCLGGGTSVDLSTLKGPLIINFWWEGCVPCRHEMPALAAFYKQYGDQVPLIGVDSTDVYPGVALRKAVNWGVTFPLLADPGGDLQGTKLTIHNYPSFFFLTAQGKLIGPVLVGGGVDSVAEVKALVEKNLGLHL